MNTDITERLVRFQQPEKVLDYLGGLDATRTATLFGLDATTYGSIRDSFEEQLRQVASDLLADPDFARQVDRLPFEPDQHLVAIGESTTADRLSWFEILRHVLALRHPTEGIRLSNLAISGSTTTQALTQLPSLSFHRPDWVLCMLGGNDSQRLGPDNGPTLVSPEETGRNLAALRDLARQRTATRWAWLTPTAVCEKRVAEYLHFQRAQIRWTNADLDRIAEFLLNQPEPAVDTRTATNPRTTQGLHLDDGVHLALAGQRAVTVTLVNALGGQT